MIGHMPYHCVTNEHKEEIGRIIYFDSTKKKTTDLKYNTFAILVECTTNKIGLHLIQTKIKTTIIRVVKKIPECYLNRIRSKFEDDNIWSLSISQWRETHLNHEHFFIEKKKEKEKYLITIIIPTQV